MLSQDEDEPATQALDEDDVVIMRTYGHEAQFAIFALLNNAPNDHFWLYILVIPTLHRMTCTLTTCVRSYQHWCHSRCWSICGTYQSSRESWQQKSTWMGSFGKDHQSFGDPNVSVT